VTLTRTQFQGLRLAAGDPVWVRPAPGAPTVVAIGPPPGDEELVPT
jgi:hypothetical protein